LSVESSALGVGGSPRSAVFLSYASQDAEAAQRLAEALRAAGVEVWFDQSELVGGDAWDAKIRKQIKECVLLIPIISAATQARREGYFRLEWRLAVERMRQMDDDLAFLLPVVIDSTKEAEAFVPDRFREVQWTRLPAGETPVAFANRVKKLLGGSAMEPGRPRPGTESPGEIAGPPEKSSRRWLVPAIVGVVAVSALAVWLTRNPAPAPQTASVAASPADELVAKARALLDDDPLMTRANVELAEQLSLQAIAKEQTDGEAYAVAAWANFRFLEANYEDTPPRRADLCGKSPAPGAGFGQCRTGHGRRPPGDQQPARSGRAAPGAG